MASPSQHAAAILTRLDGVLAMDLEVLDNRALTDALCELRFGGVPAGFAPWPGQDLMFGVADAHGAHRWRRYTVRSHGDGELRAWVTTDTDGPGAAWARAAVPGSRIEAVGPRGKIAVREDAGRHVFAVDESGAAAALAMAEGLQHRGEAAVLVPAGLLGVARGELAGAPAVSLAVLPSAAAEAREPGTLDAALADAVAGAADVAAYAFGELVLVRRLRAALVAAGVPDGRIAHKAYWRADQPNEDRGEPARPDSE